MTKNYWLQNPPKYQIGEKVVTALPIWDKNKGDIIKIQFIGIITEIKAMVCEDDEKTYLYGISDNNKEGSPPSLYLVESQFSLVDDEPLS